MNITFWGTRGSMPAPYPNRMLYGGNTSCVCAAWKGGLAVFDAGTGIRELGIQLAAADEIRELHLFLSHLHLDHVMGLPFFPLLFQKAWVIHIYGEGKTDTGFSEEVTRLSQNPYWPVSLKEAAATLIWHELSDGSQIELPAGAKLDTMSGNHPNGSLLYRLETNEGSMVYGLDCEITETIRAAYQDFVRNCDLLIFDGMYTEEEYPSFRGYGHSTWQQGAALQKECNIKQLCISHHDWSRSDEELSRLETILKQKNPDALFAREGMTMELKGE